MSKFHSLICQWKSRFCLTIVPKAFSVFFSSEYTRLWNDVENSFDCYNAPLRASSKCANKAVANLSDIEWGDAASKQQGDQVEDGVAFCFSHSSSESNSLTFTLSHLRPVLMLSHFFDLLYTILVYFFWRLLSFLIIFVHTNILVCAPLLFPVRLQQRNLFVFPQILRWQVARTSAVLLFSKRGEFLHSFGALSEGNLARRTALFVCRRNNDDYLFASLGLSTAGSLSFASAFHFLRPPDRTMALRLFWIKTRGPKIFYAALCLPADNERAKEQCELSAFFVSLRTRTRHQSAQESSHSTKRLK
jgi:hypothetical protein